MGEREADQRFRRLAAQVTTGPGRLESSVRRAAFADQPVPEALQALTTKILTGAYQVTADDIARARAAGYTEDQLFELTVASAAGSGLRRLATVERLLAEGKDDA